MGGIPDILESKGSRGFKEGQYHKCSKCGKLVENYRTYIRTRQSAYDYDRGVFGDNNPRKFQPIGWFCIECKHLDIDENIPGAYRVNRRRYQENKKVERINKGIEIPSA